MILCDTGPLVAAFNKADDDHERRARFLARNWGPVQVAGDVLPGLDRVQVIAVVKGVGPQDQPLGPYRKVGG